MKKPLFSLMFCVFLQACASQDSYITSCHEPACKLKAQYTEHAFQERNGLAVITSPAITFTIDPAVSKVAKQGDILAFFSSDGWRVGATTLSATDIGLKSDQASMRDFMGKVFLEDFSALTSKPLDDALLHAVRSFKISSFTDASPRYFQRENLTIFYYSTEESNQYKVYVIDDTYQAVVTMIDLYGFTQDRFERFITTLNHQ